MPEEEGPTPTMNDLTKSLFDLRYNLLSDEGSAQEYIDSGARSSLESAMEELDMVEPEGYEPPDEPILDVGPAVGLLSGIQHAIGILAPSMPAAAGLFLKSVIDDMMNSIPH